MEFVTIEGVRSHLVLPTGEGPAPAVIVIHELFGLNADIDDITRRFAAAGYVALAPDLYSDGFRPLCIARTVTDVFTRDAGATARRIDLLRAWLADRPDVLADRIGVIGFCMGGAIAVVSAAVGDFAAASVNYGKVPRDTAVLEGICPTIGSYGAADRPFRGDAARLRAALADLDVPHEVTLYDGAGHSFLNRSLPGAITRRVESIGYAPAQAAQAWDRILAFFAAHLGGTAPAP